jgi:molybdopterin synthase catalytic subunit
MATAATAMATGDEVTVPQVTGGFGVGRVQNDFIRCPDRGAAMPATPASGRWQFVGTVRAENDAASVTTMTLEHYPGMTEKALAQIETEARARWALYDALIVHRIGRLAPCDQIVLVAVSAAHRGEAFAACEFIVEYLKTRAPFWKKEETPAGAHWVDARVADDDAAARWERGD